MNTSRIEELLEQLLDKQDELISRIESLEQVFSKANSSILDLKDSSLEISDSLNWWEGKPTFATQLFKILDAIESAASER